LLASLRGFIGDAYSGVVLATLARLSAQIIICHLPPSEVEGVVKAFHLRVDAECEAQRASSAARRSMETA
jgi:hypothetical protein